VSAYGPEDYPDDEREGILIGTSVVLVQVSKQLLPCTAFQSRDAPCVELLHNEFRVLAASHFCTAARKNNKNKINFIAAQGQSMMADRLCHERIVKRAKVRGWE
jgi:hypothetical protein